MRGAARVACEGLAVLGDMKYPTSSWQALYLPWKYDALLMGIYMSFERQQWLVFVVIYENVKEYQSTYEVTALHVTCNGNDGLQVGISKESI